MSSFKIRPDGLYDPEGKYPNPLTHQPYSKNYSKIALSVDPKGWSRMTAYEDRHEIMKKIHNNSILLVILPTGTGKTVVVPRLLFHYFGYEKKVIVTTPRQQTTSSAGTFAAKCYDVPLFHLDEKGKEIINPNVEKGQDNTYPTGLKIVGYKHGGSKEYADDTTKLLFATDGTIKSMITGTDPTLSEYGGIVIDEVHERSLDIDTLIALVMNILNKRPEFKIIFMSATMDPKPFEDYFKRLGFGKKYSIYTIEGAQTTYKIDEKNSEKPEVKKAAKLLDVVNNKIHSIMMKFNETNENGDILAFLSSDAELGKLKKLIEKNLHKYNDNNKPYIITMSSKTPESEMDIAKKSKKLEKIPPTKEAPLGYKRKLMIGTPMVESSITFEDPLTHVIDTGLAYTTNFNADKYCYVEGKNYTTQANIKQRCGRTGRTNDGTCHKLYTKDEYKNFTEFTVPEIQKTDFTNNLLKLMSIDVNEFNAIKAVKFATNMIEPIKNFQSFLKVSFHNLKQMDFIDKKANITQLGLICKNIGLFDFKISKMIVGGFFFKCLPASIMLGAILHTTTSLSDIFRVLNDEDKKNPEIVKRYENNKKKQIYPESDHITLLKIYNNFISNQNPYEYAEQNDLQYKHLTNIQRAHQELMEALNKNNTETRLPIIESFGYMNQFNNIKPYSGGGKINTSLYSKNKKYNKNKKLTLINDKRKHNKRNFQNNKKSISLFNRNYKYGGGVFNKYSKTKKSRVQNGNLYTNKKQGRNSKLNDIENINLFGGNLPSNKNYKRRQHYMDLFRLDNFGKRNMSLKLTEKDDMINRIIAALYYGYSINIACYTGNNKDYQVKFSDIKAKFIGDKYNHTSFDYIPKEECPDFVVYNKFTLKKDFNIEDKEGGSLNIVTKIDPNKHLKYFFNLGELRDKVMNMK